MTGVESGIYLTTNVTRLPTNNSEHRNVNGS